MKITLAVFLIFMGLSAVSAEIIPNFPGTQPIFFDGSNGAPAPPPTTGENVDRTTIDSYSIDTSPPVLILLTGPAPPVVTDSAFDFDPASIIGGERDVILHVEEGNNGLVFVAGASGGSFSVSTPNDGSGLVVLQYDGVDSSEDLDIQTGLGGVDLTLGDAVGFRVEARTDVPTEFTLSIFDSQGRSVISQSIVEGGSALQSYLLDFDDFAGAIDFSSVNAIEFQIEAFDNVDFNLQTFVTYSNIVAPPVVSGCFNDTIAPCLTKYYRLEELTDIQPGEYITLTYDQFGEPLAPTSLATFYLIHSNFEDLQDELNQNTNIISTLGGLPGATQYDYKCEDDCKIEIVWSQLQDTTYYIAVEGMGPGFVNFDICLSRSEVPVIPLVDRETFSMVNDTRIIVPDDNVRHYTYYSIDIPREEYVEGSYLQVLLARALPSASYTMRIMYEGLPEAATDTGVIGAVDTNSHGIRVDDEIYPSCVPVSFLDDFVHPISTLDNIPCECTANIVTIDDRRQLGCLLVVDPCEFRYGTWYISVELPDLGNTTTVDYELTASVVKRNVIALEPLVDYSTQVGPEAMRHFRLEIPADDISIGNTHLVVKITNVRGGFVTGYIHQDQGNFDTLAGGLEGCSAANATCTTCASCNMVIEKCHFVPGTYYLSVGVAHDDDLNFHIFDEDRLPLDFTISAIWTTDQTPEVLIAGTAVSKNIVEAVYDFYVINVPATIDTVLYIDLFAKANDTEVSMAVLHGELPGGDCYARPDFYCLTGDVRGIRSSFGTTSFIDNEPIQRESCSYMIQACELTPGPLYISVYGHHTGYAAYGDNTFYGIPVHYTLHAQFDTPLALVSGISLTETVFEAQYQHYYIGVTQASVGQWLSVEVTNIQHGVPQSIEAYVNLNFLAGECPCYDSMYTCTQNSECTPDDLYTPFAHPDIESVDNCCTVLVHPSDFSNGIWYIAIRGVSEDYFQYTTPIGYTLTATVHEAPRFNFLPLGQHYQGLAPRWNRTFEYAHFRLAADAIPLNDLVLKLTWVQNCDNAAGGKHDDSWESLSLYVNHERVAGRNPTGNMYSCTASDLTQSYCTIVIPHCQWLEGGYLLAVRGDYEADFDAQFTLVATTSEVRDLVLHDNVAQYDRVNEGLYNHYYIHTDAEEDKYLAIDVYTNQDQDAVTVFLNHDQRAGSGPCFEWTDSCHTDSCCSWQLKACELSPGRVYISVGGGESHFYHVSTEYTITAGHHTIDTPLYESFPMTGHLSTAGQIAHYSFEVDQLLPGYVLEFTVDAVKHGSVSVFSQFESLAGRCPCYTWDKTCHASSEDKEWCTIRYAPCELEKGTYFFSVYADEQLTSSPPVFMTPIGYSVDVRVIVPTYGSIEADIGRQEEDTLREHLSASRYRHYALTWDDDDFNQGYHLIVEISNVRNGELEVFYNAVSPGDQTCHDAQLCSSGIGSGADCVWQLPYCLTRPLDDPLNHYISVYNKDAGNRVSVSYDILIWKQTVPSVTENVFFSLDTADDGDLSFASGQEFNVTHNPLHEPNGWTQFIKLPNIDLSIDEDGRGEMLELFFYRITNNLDQPMSFNVYAHPNEPAGAHECCATDRASCQGAPCSQSADTTTLVNQQERITHTCVLSNGLGDQAIGDDFFGEECTVRVWPCEFSKYCDDGTPTDWFVSVVPIVPTCLSSEGPGLQYSFQWRVRNLRYADQAQQIIGTIDLSEFVNENEYTPLFSVNATTSESQGWRSFFVPFPASNAGSRLSIQTRFISGEGTVYIDRDNFASAGPCFDYECDSQGLLDCETNGRFLVTSCCGDKAEQGYFITVRNTGAPGSTVSFAFRITTTTPSAVFHMDDHPTEADPFVAISSVASENYAFYQLSIDDDDLEGDRSWIVNVERIGNVTGDLVVFLRFGAPAGKYAAGALSDYYGDEPEGCYAWQYRCVTETEDDSCFFEIPSCNMVEGHYYISLFNPAPNAVPGNFEQPEFILTTYISEPSTLLILNEPLEVIHDSSVDGLLHFHVNVTAQSGGFDDRDSIEAYWTRFLRFQVDHIANDTLIDMWVSYDAVAGPTGEQSCYASLAMRTCDAVRGCYYDVLPCGGDEGFQLVTGVYNIALRLSSATSFQITSHMLAEPYTLIEVDSIEEGVSQRSGTENVIWTYTVSQSELEADGDGEGNYRYVIDVENIENDDDDMIDNQYLIFNLTAAANTTSDGIVHLDVWRDDCTRFTCEVQGAQSWCTIDALTLGPCALKGGRYYFDIVNSERVEFTLNAYLNETILVDIQDRQEITEFIFPYEYQEYFYMAHDVGQGATLKVTVCSICGDVEAWLRPDFPAGPTPDVTGELDSCSVDYCATDSETNLAFGNLPGANCCVMFLDTCEYSQRGYYVGVRGVTVSFPTLANQILYLPAQYKIDIEQTTVNFTEITHCEDVVVYEESWTDVPQQFTYDLETLNIGDQLKFTMNVAYAADASIEDLPIASMWVKFNSSIGYSEQCPSSSRMSCNTTTSCEVIVPYCALAANGATRAYIWVDSSRGTEIHVERSDSIAPVIQTDILYHATTNGNALDCDTPYQPTSQHYRFDIHPMDEDYSKFFVRVAVSNVQYGSISATINTGQYPFTQSTGCAIPLFFDGASCSDVTDECYIDIEWRDIQQTNEFLSSPRTFWLTVTGESQDCELNSISYNFVVQSNFVITYYPVGETICNEVDQGDYNFHRIKSSVEHPQESFLRVTVADLDPTDQVSLLMQEGRLATVSRSMVTLESENGHAIVEDYFCGYENLYVSVHGDVSGDGTPIDYRMTVEKAQIHVKELFDDSVYHADDDDDDACPHQHDFYRFALPENHVSVIGSFFRVLVDSEFDTQVYVNRGSVAWKNCFNAGSGSNEPRTSGTTSVNVYDFCDYDDTPYYITVISDGPYYIYTDVRDDPKELTIGEIFRDTLEPAMYQVYTLEICDEWLEADDRLVIEITDVEHGDVYGWVRYEGNPGDFSTNAEEGNCGSDSALAKYGQNESGYDFLLVNSCELKAGTYHILIRASPHPGSPERDCQHVNYRLYPYLIDYEIVPDVLTPNTVIHDVVDYYTVNRIDESSAEFINYYTLRPFEDDEGYREQISQAVARLANVEGGLLRLRVMCDHLALAEFGYFDGEIYGLTKDDLVVPEWNMQSGRHPFTYQRMLDSRNSIYQPECDGCTDLCCEMSYDDIDEYKTDKSCAVWIPSCYLVWADLYLAVEPVVQYSQDHSIYYDLAIQQTADFARLQPNTPYSGSFDDNNWDYDFVYSLTTEAESMKWRVVVTDGEGVLVTVRNHRCPLQASWSKEIWCDAAYFDRPWMCDIEIPTMAAHPGSNAFFLSIYGKNATYTLGNWVGRENCHAFVGSGRNDGLDFCAGLLPYAVWRWDSYVNLDNQANCLFEELYESFKSQPCFTGVTPECNGTLAAFACYEKFHRCDENGFAVSTCRQACDSVVHECFNSFDAVNLEYYNCTSPRYADGYAHTCSMSDALLHESFNMDIQMNNPDLLAFDASPASYDEHSPLEYETVGAVSSSSASVLSSGSLFTLMVVSLIVLLF